MSAKDNCKDVKYPITAQNVSITCGGSLDFMGLRPLQEEDGVIPYRRDLGLMDTGQWLRGQRRCHKHRGVVTRAEGRNGS